MTKFSFHKFDIRYLNNLIMAKIQINGRKINIKQKINVSDLLKKYEIRQKNSFRVKW